MWTRKDKNDAGVSFIVGTSETGKHGTQAVRFSKDHWTEAEAKKWWSKNKTRFTKTWTPADWIKRKKKKLKESRLVPTPAERELQNMLGVSERTPEER